MSEMNLDKQTNFDELQSYQLLRRHLGRSDFKKKLLTERISLKIFHHELHEDVLLDLANLCEEQGFFKAQALWKNQVVTPQMPYYMRLRNFQFNTAEFEDILTMRRQMKSISDKINQGQWLGFSQKPILDIVNIGMGGSDLGPHFCNQALSSYQKNKLLRFHFISNADIYAFEQILEKLYPETTLFIISSKSFTTQETMQNAKMAGEWIGHAEAMAKHFIAVTANPKKAEALGYKNIVGFGEWVVGRYSCTSAINLINAIAWGYADYEAFLQGAHEMDQHFLKTPWMNNLPVMLALIGIWNINFLDIRSHLMLIYDARLNDFCDYIQQLDMESNGKSHNQFGQAIDYATAPIVWGGDGNQAQHSYYQLLTQGKHQIAMDFVNVCDSKNYSLNQMCHNRIDSLFHGTTSNDASQKTFAQQAINHIELNELTPKSLGALIALYEHKIFTQAWIWNINPFNQPGVELAKKNETILEIF